MPRRPKVRPLLRERLTNDSQGASHANRRREAGFEVEVARTLLVGSSN